MNISLNQLVTELRRNSAYQNSESDYLSNTDLEELIKDAATLHNESYVVTDSSSNVPVREKLCVIYLAWTKVCLIRASHWANNTDISGASGFAEQRSNPFSNNLRMAKELEGRYNQLCATLNVSGSGGPVVSDGIQTSMDTSTLSPSNVVPDLPTVLLDSPTVTAGNSTLNFSYEKFLTFAELFVFHREGNEPITQLWNYNSTSGVARIADGLTPLLRTSRHDLRSVKVNDLNMTVGTVHRFVVVIRSLGGQTKLSNEVTYVIPAP